jgi:hypothetical protein
MYLQIVKKTASVPRIEGTMVETLIRAVTPEGEEWTRYLPRRLEVGLPLVHESGIPLLGKTRRNNIHGISRGRLAVFQGKGSQ